MSVVGYTVGWETYHVSHDKTFAVFDPSYHHNVWYSVYGLQAFEDTFYLFFSNLLMHLVSIGIMQKKNVADLHQDSEHLTCSVRMNLSL